MAYGEQTFTNIGTVQAPDASQSTAFAGSTPFTFSESTNQLLNQVTQQAVKRRENEVETFNKNLQSALTKVSDIPEGLAEQDYEEITKKKKNIIKEYYNNPEVFLGKNPTKAKELDELLVDLASYTQLSKATKKVDDVYSDLIKKDSDYNNEVNNYYIAKNRAIKDPYERSKNAFTPIKNPMNDFNNVTYPKIVASSETEVETLPDPNDAGTLIINQKKKIDKNVFSEAFKRDNGMYLTEEWNIHPEIHGEYPTPELYIQSKIEDVYKPEFVTTSKTKNLVQYQEAQKNARNEASIEGRATEGEANRAVRLQIASEKASSRNPELKNISPIISNIDGFEDNITNTVEIPKMVQKEIGVQKFSEVSPTYVNEKIIKGIYPNGASQYGDAYGKLFIVTDTKGNQYYTPAKEHFKIKGKEVSKDEYEQAQKIGSKNISKEILPNNDKGKRYTKETLLGSAIDNTTNGAYEFDIWKKANEELKNVEVEDAVSNNLLQSANKYKDVDYGFGAKGKGGKMDCSGLVCAILNDNGVKVSGTSESIVSNAPIKPDIKTFEDIQVGDVIGVDTGKTSFDKGRTNGIDHIGIVIEENGKKYFVESRGSKGFDKTPIEDKLTKYQKDGYGLYFGRYNIGGSNTTEPKVPTNTGTKKKAKNTYGL